MGRVRSSAILPPFTFLMLKLPDGYKLVEFLSTVQLVREGQHGRSYTVLGEIPKPYSPQPPEVYQEWIDKTVAKHKAEQHG